MYLMVESGIRGGVSVVTHKYAKANNQYLESEYDSSKPISHCIYLDANNLYGWAMSQKMPYGNLRFLTSIEIEQLNIYELKDDADTGYIFEVDLDYPDHLHDLHNDLPVAPVQRKVLWNELSPYTKTLTSHLPFLMTTTTTPTATIATSSGSGSSSSSGSNDNSAVSDNAQADDNCTGYRASKKLIADLHNKRNYVVHYRNLKQYLNLGLVLKKIHRAISFSQSLWLQQYISLNTSKRMQAKNAFEKDFFKLMNNSVFGKTMENVRKHVNIELVNSDRRLKQLTARPVFHRMNIISKDLCAVRTLRTSVKLNKPIYVGFSILDLSKLLMYDFHYSVIKERYGNFAQLCFTDTDSLFYHVLTDDIYSDMSGEQAELHYDFSDYPTNHALHSIKKQKSSRQNER